MATSEKLSRLMAMLEKQPDDSFLLYGIGVEHKNLKDPARAIDYLDRCIAADPNYCYAYFQKGQVLESSGDIQAARSAYEDGILAARRAGDAHALSEIAGALQMIE